MIKEKGYPFYLLFIVVLFYAGIRIHQQIRSLYDIYMTSQWLYWPAAIGFPVLYATGVFCMIPLKKSCSYTPQCLMICEGIAVFLLILLLFIPYGVFLQYRYEVVFMPIAFLTVSLIQSIKNLKEKR